MARLVIDNRMNLASRPSPLSCRPIAKPFKPANSHPRQNSNPQPPPATTTNQRPPNHAHPLIKQITVQTMTPSPQLRRPLSSSPQKQQPTAQTTLDHTQLPSPPTVILVKTGIHYANEPTNTPNVPAAPNRHPRESGEPLRKRTYDHPQLPRPLPSSPPKQQPTPPVQPPQTTTTDQQPQNHAHPIIKQITVQTMTLSPLTPPASPPKL